MREVTSVIRVLLELLKIDYYYTIVAIEVQNVEKCRRMVQGLTFVELWCRM